MKYVRNEWMKLWSKKGSWVMTIITILIVLIPAIILIATEDPEDTPEQRKAANEETIKNYNVMLEDEDVPDEVKAEFAESKMLAEYRIEHDIPSDSTTTIDRFMGITLDIASLFIPIFVIIIAAGIVSQEFSTGTIKMLLTRPVARWKILFSKLVTTILYGLFLYVITISLSALVGVILFGTDASTELSIVNGAIEEQNPFINYFKTLALSFGPFFMSLFFAFMLGSIFGSSSIAVGITIVISFMGSVIVTLLSKYDFTKYIWISNDLTQFAPGQLPIIDGLTLPFSITVNAIYAIIFLAVSFIYFIKRDVTA